MSTDNAEVRVDSLMLIVTETSQWAADESLRETTLRILAVMDNSKYDNCQRSYASSMPTSNGGSGSNTGQQGNRIKIFGWLG